jgi:hypothetical protein
MPEATIHKDNHSAPWKDDIGSAGQNALMKAKAKACPMQCSPEVKLRLGVFLSNGRHHGGAPLLRNNI